DGIRDFHVTGVQTCALPILSITAGPKESGVTFEFPSPTTSPLWLGFIFSTFITSLIIYVKASSHFFRSSWSCVLIACVSRADRKSTRLNSSHVKISYAVFCLKKKNGLLNKYYK